MAFKLLRETKHQIIAQERLYLTQDKSRVVSEGDKEAAFLLAAPGQPIPIALAKRLGLDEEEPAGVEPATRANRRATPSATR